MKIKLAHLNQPDILAEINNGAVPDVNELDAVKARWLMDNAALALVALLDGRAAGVIIALGEDSGYDSNYFRWFTDRYRRFIYIDRVIVATWARGRGVASRFYQEVDRLAGELDLAIAADVYSDPPNTPSLNFHQKMGYAEVGQQFCQSEGKTVAKLLKYPDRAQAITAGT